MRPEDLAALHAAAFAGEERPWTAAEFAALLGHPTAFLLGDARAILLGRVAGDEAEVLTLATHPSHRRQGLGLALLTEFAAEARARGAATGFLEVAADNAPARALYEGAGWEEAGRRRGYYRRASGPAADALVLRKAPL